MAEMPLIHKNLGGPWAAHPCCDTKAIQKLHRATKDTTSTSAEISTEQEPDAGSLDVPPNWTGMDYAGCLICLPLAPLGAMLFPLLWITYAPAILAGKIYLATCKRPVKIVERTCGFHFFSFFVFLLSFMGLILTFFYWIYFTVVVVSLSLIISILSGRIRLFFNNWALLKPYRHWPEWTWEDMVCVMMGAMDRQGYFEFLYRFPSVLLITPVLKYVFTTNPLIHDLSEQFINQWTVPLQMNESNALASVVMDISWTAHTEADREAIDADPFSAHYPLPPPGRASNSVVGVQFTNILVNITKTTHNVTGENRSQSGKRGIFIVDLYFWNPCHLLTGVVEVNLQYRGGVEHPMWCVIGKNHWAVQLFKNVDNLFWRYAPSAATFFQGHGVEHVDPKQS